MGIGGGLTGPIDQDVLIASLLIVSAVDLIVSIAPMVHRAVTGRQFVKVSIATAWWLIVRGALAGGAAKVIWASRAWTVWRIHNDVFSGLRTVIGAIVAVVTGAADDLRAITGWQNADFTWAVAMI
jgi:hypothetical protein